jgi:DNA-binding transcriptional LysR family regulator
MIRRSQFRFLSFSSAIIRRVGTVLVRHDVGCKWSRFEGTVDSEASILTGEIRPGHSDAAKRFSDAYNLHKAAGSADGWMAVALADGHTDGELYASRPEAIAHQHHNERWYFYCRLGPATLSVCAAESLLRYKRVMNELEGPHTHQDAPNGGLEVIPRLTQEDMEAQIRAVRSGQGMVAMGHRR